MTDLDKFRPAPGTFLKLIGAEDFPAKRGAFRGRMVETHSGRVIVVQAAVTLEMAFSWPSSPNVPAMLFDPSGALVPGVQKPRETADWVDYLAQIRPVQVPGTQNSYLPYWLFELEEPNILRLYRLEMRDTGPEPREPVAYAQHKGSMVVPKPEEGAPAEVVNLLHRYWDDGRLPVS